MNPNRQNNFCPSPAGAGFMGRPGGRQSMPCPANVAGNTPCCSDAASVQPIVPCCSDVATGGIIIGGGAQECDKETALRGLPIAMAYVPWQCYGNIYQLPQALQNGTLFRELDLEFAGRRCN